MKYWLEIAKGDRWIVVICRENENGYREGWGYEDAPYSWVSYHYFDLQKAGRYNESDNLEETLSKSFETIQELHIVEFIKENMMVYLRTLI